MQPTARRNKVLVVDDEMDMRIFLSRLLERDGYEPVLACKGFLPKPTEADELPGLLNSLTQPIPRAREPGTEAAQWTCESGSTSVTAA